MNPNDAIRKQILQYFYDRNANATSRMGKRGSAVKISDAKRELKDRYGLSQKQVMANLTYLIDNGWVKTIDITKTVTVRGGTIPQVTTYYEVTSKGIDKVEGGSQFEPKDRFAGINITAAGENIITLGDGNIIHAEFSDLHAALDELKEAITASGELEEVQKLSAVTDIETIKAQLARKDPQRQIIGIVWDSLQKMSTLCGIAEALAKVGPLLHNLLP